MPTIDALAEEIKAMTPAEQLRLAAEILDRAKERPDLVVKVARPIVQRVADDLALLALSRAFK
jgi:hypothetical protein